MSELPFSFGKDFQDSMLSLMLRDISFADRAVKYLGEEYLHSDNHKWLFGEIKKKFLDSGNVPSLIEIEDNLKKTARARRRLYKTYANKIYSTAPVDPDFIRDKLTEYSKRVSFAELFRDGQLFYNAGETEKAYTYVMEAINHLHSISYRQDVSIPIEEFEALRKRHAFEQERSGYAIPTNIKALDEVLGGGLERGRLGVIMAEPKRGKSIGLIHMGVAALMSRAGIVAHVVLEGTTEETVMRYQSRLSGIPYNRLSKDDLTAVEVKHLEVISAKYLDRLQLIPFNQHWEYTVLDLESKLQELDRQGKTPDLCVVDYADLLQPRKSDSRRRDLDQRDVYRELKRLSIVRRMATWTASQAQRPKEYSRSKSDAVLHGSSISESFEKVRIADFIGSLNQTPQEKKQGVLRFHCDVYRSNASDKTIRLITNFSRMIFHTAHFGTLDSSHIPKWARKAT